MTDLVRAGLAAALAAALALAGCGGEDRSADTAPPPPPTPSATQTPVATATESPTATPPPTATPESPEDQEGGAGDEAEARVPVAIIVRPGGVQPAKVSIPAFLALELSVRNRTTEEITVRIVGPERPAGTVVAPGATATKPLAGLRPGRYAIETGAGRRATLIVGVEPGP